MSQHIKRGTMIYLIRDGERQSKTCTPHKSLAYWLKAQGFRSVSRAEYERAGKRDRR